MASLAKDGRLLFNLDGKRRVVRLGKLPKKRQQKTQRHIEELLSCKLDGSTAPKDTRDWLKQLDAKFYAKLVKVGLVDEWGASTVRTLGELLDAYKARPKWLAYKPSTRSSKQAGFAHLLRHFGEDKPINSLNAAEAGDFYDKLRLAKDRGGYGLAEATCNLTTGTVHALFNYAIDCELIDRNPFRNVPRTPQAGENATVPDALCREILDSLSDSQDRLMFALCRWGGLRMPSDAKGLRWCDIDWANERFLVHSPKTERYKGRGKRWVPIFVELAPLFDERFSEAAEGEEYVLPRLHTATQGYPTDMLRRTLTRHGVDPWPRLWHSMRSTRQTELEVLTRDRYIVCAWLGNTPKVADKHYVNFTEQHFKDRASEVAHFCAQQTPASGGKAQQVSSERQR